MPQSHHLREFRRVQILARFGATPSETIELLAYNANPFDHGSRIAAAANEPFVDAWRSYALQARTIGVFETLRKSLVQLRYPIEKGISTTESYLRATRRGEAPTEISAGMTLEEPNRLRLEIHPTPAGHIPLIIAPNRTDFISLVRSLTRRNEPAAIPDAMGACMVAGYNNWDRVAAYRRNWLQRSGNTEAEWADEFRRLVSQKDLYQDRFIILSDGPYSAVPAEELGLDDATWCALSLNIRREHECVHYFTRRVLGSMGNNALDELIADYMGITATVGHFDSGWFLRFMGLEDFPRYRAGGRLEHYRGDLSSGAFRVLQALLVAAASQLERARLPPATTIEEQRHHLYVLTRVTLEELASDTAAARLRRECSQLNILTCNTNI